MDGLTDAGMALFLISPTKVSLVFCINIFPQCKAVNANYSKEI